MIKYVPSMTSVVLEEIPDRVSLAVDISNCTGLCEGCHSPFLRKDIGEELTLDVVRALLDDNFGVNCFLLLGEGNDHTALINLAVDIRKAYPALEIALYSGRESVEDDIYRAFDYVKVGPYRPSCGPLNNPATNQRLYRVHYQLPAGNKSVYQTEPECLADSVFPTPGYTLEDLTPRFWHRGIDSVVNGTSELP